MLRKLLVAAVIMLAAVAGGGAWFLHRADHDPRYANVVSIADAPYYQSAEAIERAWALPVASLYREGFEFQANPSFCGPTSAANVTRSLGKDADQISVIAGTTIKPILGILPGGVTLDQEAEILRSATGASVEVLRDLTIEEFRTRLIEANDPGFRYVVNFTRAPLWGEGHGHISPILGYLAEEDLVFVGDVNKRFGPFLVSPERLLEAMNTLDDSSGKSRGLLRIGDR